MRELLKIDTSGITYGIWKDEIITISELKSINKLPFSHSSIAGITIIDNHLATLADLPACLGLSPINKKALSQVLYISDKRDIAGFVIQGSIDSIQISPDDVYSMPEYFHIPIIKTCVAHQYQLIPVIDIIFLLNLVQNADYEFSIEEAFIPDIKNNKTSDKQFRLIRWSGETYALCASSFENSVNYQRMTVLSLTPEYITGIILHNKQIMPVINLMKRMDIAAKESNLMLVCKIDEQSYGFIIDSDKGPLNSIHSIQTSFPIIAKSKWMNSAVISDGDIIPVINTEDIISLDDIPSNNLQTGYSPDSNLKASINHEDIKVVEFSLLGMKHAIPKSEAIKTLKMIPYRQIPNVLPVVAGIAEYDNKLLPVLDLAMCFGMRSNVSRDWQMILIENGDFQALVLTEKVLDERNIPASIHRDLPFLLGHDIVYVCYPDDNANAIRLVLNVYALAVYFNKDMVKELFKAFSHEIHPSSAEVVSSLLDEKGTAFKITKSFEKGEESGKKSIVEESEVSPIITGMTMPAADEDIAEQIDAEIQIEKEYIKAEYDLTQIDDSIFEPEKISASSKGTSKDKVPDKIEVTPKVEHESPYSQGTLPADKDKKSPVSFNKKEAPKSHEITKDKEKEKATADAESHTTAQVIDNIPFKKRAESTLPSKQSKLKYVYGAVALFIITIFYFISIYFTKISIINEKADQSKSNEIIDSTGNKQVVLNESENKSDIIEKNTSQILYKTITHDVIQGDTLYNITKFYTGNGWDFNKVASENNIENPDLIFPNQKIKIIIPNR